MSNGVKNIPIFRKRGDTFPLKLAIVKKSTIVNITGFSYRLVVDPLVKPTTSANNLFDIAGTLTDAVNGKVQFNFSVANVNQTPKKYFYEIQQTDGSSLIRTILEGSWVFEQDIVK